jgi:hypothetical protein
MKVSGRPFVLVLLPVEIPEAKVHVWLGRDLSCRGLKFLRVAAAGQWTVAYGEGLRLLPVIT